MREREMRKGEGNEPSFDLFGRASTAFMDVEWTALYRVSRAFFCHNVRTVCVCCTLCCAALLFRDRVDKHISGGAVIQVDVLHFSEIIEATRSNTVAGAIPLSPDAGERSKLKAIRVRAFRCEPDDPIVCDLALRRHDS